MQLQRGKLYKLKICFSGKKISTSNYQAIVEEIFSTYEKCFLFKTINIYRVNIENITNLRVGANSLCVKRFEEEAFF